MLTMRVYWEENTVHVEISKDGAVIDTRSIKDIPAEVYTLAVVPDMRKQAEEMGAMFEIDEKEGEAYC